MAIEDMEDEEKEDYYIKETDALIIAGKVVRLSLIFRIRSMPVSKSTSTNRIAIISTFIMRL